MENAVGPERLYLVFMLGKRLGKTVHGWFADPRWGYPMRADALVPMEEYTQLFALLTLRTAYLTPVARISEKSNIENQDFLVVTIEGRAVFSLMLAGLASASPYFWLS